MVQNGLWISSPKISERYVFVAHVLFGTDQANAIYVIYVVIDSIMNKISFHSKFAALF